MVDGGRAEARSWCAWSLQGDSASHCENEQTTCWSFTPERQSKNIKQRQTLALKQLKAPAGLVNISFPISPCCLSPGPSEAAGLPGTSVWRWGRSISKIWAGETPPKRPGIHTDKPITSSELIIPRDHDNTNIPRTETSLFLWRAAVFRALNLCLNWQSKYTQTVAFLCLQECYSFFNVTLFQSA